MIFPTAVPVKTARTVAGAFTRLGTTLFSLTHLLWLNFPSAPCGLIRFSRRVAADAANAARSGCPRVDQTMSLVDIAIDLSTGVVDIRRMCLGVLGRFGHPSC